MAINFPSAPNSGDVHTVGSIIWKYNGKAWDSLYEPSAPAQVGLSNVDNTSDEDKPVSTAQQAALDALTKDDVGLDNVDNTSDMNKPVSTAQQAAIDAAGGGSSFDQDLNTTDSPTFATLTTTNTVATDVYAVDVSTTGTVTATNLSVTDVYAGNVGADNVDVDADITTTNLDASGTVTAGTVTADEVSTDTFQVASGGYAFKSGVTTIASFFAGSATIRGNVLPGINGIYDLGASFARWDDLFVERVDASGTVTAGGFVGTPQTLTDAATITYDLADGHNAKVTLTASRTLSLPSNLAEGASGVLTITQDGTGGHGLTLASGWFVSAGALSDISALGASEQAQITWYAYESNKVNATILPLQ